MKRTLAVLAAIPLAAGSQAASEKNIVQTAAGAPQFSTQVQDASRPRTRRVGDLTSFNINLRSRTLTAFVGGSRCGS